MRKIEGANWKVFSVPEEFKQSQYKRYTILTASIFLLLILGAWVSSSPTQIKDVQSDSLTLGLSVKATFFQVWTTAVFWFKWFTESVQVSWV